MRGDKTITGFNVGVNVGASAGQTIFHVHVHLIPRRDGDMSNPRGRGARGLSPNAEILTAISRADRASCALWAMAAS